MPKGNRNERILALLHLIADRMELSLQSVFRRNVIDQMDTDDIRNAYSEWISEDDHLVKRYDLLNSAL